MRAFITDPSAPRGVRLSDVPEPQPQPGEALVQVHAYSINRGELSLIPARPNAWRPGQDLAGIVLAAASDGTGPPAGARVVGLADNGSWAERVAVPTARLVALPDAVIFEQAAALPIAGLTALRALRIDGPLVGRHVLVTGATGGVGGTVLRDALARCAPRATIAMYAGQSSVELGLSSFRQAPLARVLGFFVYAEHGTTMAEDLETLVGLVADGRLRPRLGLCAPWKATHDALAALAEHRVAGKAVLTVR